ncbi:MAG: hypothetical protein JSS69_11350 [Acidobacteria bacterium]|nr:hypothetical protein [Acidobacteriota bacterium]MBS1866499.1 hypothetical protein [Acidobacteriota bacterium]
MTPVQKIATEELALLRHALATVAYRAAKTLRDAPASFGDFSCGEGGRTPRQILAHMGDLYDWALSIAAGKQVWNDAEPLPWEKEVERFFASLKKFDDYLAAQSALHETPAALFQGPIADSLTHVGQLAMLRRMAGHRMKGENYHKAEIVAGRVGAEQAIPRREF